MILLLTSLLAGIFSVLAPCVLPMLPLLLSGSPSNGRIRSPWRLIAGLCVSIFAFSILLKSTTLLLGVPVSIWKAISGGIVLLYGITIVWPLVWEKIANGLGIANFAYSTNAKSNKRQDGLGDVILGASLGPIFSVCSPTYALIVASILPASPIKGVVYLLTYLLGLATMLFAIAIGGRKVVIKMGWSANPNGSFRRVLGIVLIVLGLLILTGLDKEILSTLVQSGLFDWQISLENFLAN